MKKSTMGLGLAIAVASLAAAGASAQTRGVTPTEVLLGMHTDLSGVAATYVDQIRSGIDYFVKTKGKKAICVMYQDTDFGKEVLEGAELQAKKLGIKVVETAAHKPTDQDFTASITKLRSAGCDLIAM